MPLKRKMELNEKLVREKYKEFYGINIEQMKLLIKDKRIPLTMKQIIERRLNSKQDSWKNNYFDTCDAIAYGKDGKFKIIKNCDILKKITEKTKLENGAIKITKQQYKKFKGREFNKDSSKEEIWKELLENLYGKYIKFLGYIPEFYILDENYTLRAWFVNRLGSRSNASGRNYLDDDDGRFVGIASEMLKEKNYERIRFKKTRL